MRTSFTFAFLLLLALAASGCKDSVTDNPAPNKQPTTRLWLMPDPDSTIGAGKSRQLVHWSGDDADGLVKGFIVASGRLVSDPRRPVYGDGIVWRYTAVQESLIAFPLLSALDTFQIAVRAVDNTFLSAPDEQATLRTSAGKFYWDRNLNGIHDSTDIWLTALPGAADPTGAVLNFPVINQPPTMEFFNTSDSTVALAQPETTFTAASFSWRAFDPDGDETVVQYELALNDSTDAARRLAVGANVRLASLVVPRSRSNGIVGTQEVDADVWAGTFAGTRRLLGTLGHLRLNARNTLYMRARDVAGAYSAWVRIPGELNQYWYVKNPRGTVLLVNDYTKTDRDSVVAFYRNIALSQISPRPEVDVLDIGRGVTVSQKKDGMAGKYVPALLDPAFLYTLHLYDLVIWFTDEVPSLAVAQYPLFQYVRDPAHHGKVIFTTMFENSTDPRNALVDFAPLDSISSVTFPSNFKTPTIGARSIPPGYVLHPAAGYPSLKFNPKTSQHVVFFRPVYRRPDASYIYRMQRDTGQAQIRFNSLYTLNDLNGAAAAGSKVWACGVNGTIIASSDEGATWSTQPGAPEQTLNAMHFIDDRIGWAVGQSGTIMNTVNGGATWNQKVGISFEHLTDVFFRGAQLGFICGTNGLILRSGNGGASWQVRPTPTGVTLRSISFGDTSTGIAVGDNGVTLRSTDGGRTWAQLRFFTSRPLRACTFASPSHVEAVGDQGQHFLSRDGGVTWTSGSAFKTLQMNAIEFRDANTGFAAGANGSVFKTTDGGVIWTQPATGIEYVNNPNLGQLFNALAFTGSAGVVGAGTGGLVMQSLDNGGRWTIQPQFDLNVATIDGTGQDGRRSFFFIGLPLHLLNGDGTNVPQLLNHVITNEFGL